MLKETFWRTQTEIDKRSPLDKNISTEVAVIGAGMAGILIADRLKSSGKEVVVLEADRIASGQTEKTTAKITAQHGCVYGQFAENFSLEKARLYAQANTNAVEWYRKTVKTRNIECDFEDRDSYIYSSFEYEKLKREAQICKKIGFSAEFVENVELPFDVACGVKITNGAQFNPLKFIKGISDDITIYEKTPIRTVKGNTVYSDKFTVEAQSVVFACHYPFLIIPGLYFARMYQQRSYVLAIRDNSLCEGMYIGVDNEGYSLRQYRDLLLLGGKGHRTGENSSGKSFDELCQVADKYYPNAEKVAFWSAQDCITADGMAYIGRLSSFHPNWYVATGFGKWGMTGSAVAADIIADLIVKGESRYEKLFTPKRFSFAAALGVAKETGKAIKGLARGNLHIPKHKLSSLKVGQGGIVNVDGKRVGVYRESENKYYSVIPRCTHMGCGLEWNPVEKSWDCPCHGSRFDFKGNLLDNPAKQNLKHPPEF